MRVEFLWKFSFLKIYVIGSTQIDLLGIFHVKVGFFAVLKMCIRAHLGKFAWSTLFVQCEISCLICDRKYLIIISAQYFSYSKMSTKVFRLNWSVFMIRIQIKINKYSRFCREFEIMFKVLIMNTINVEMLCDNFWKLIAISKSCLNGKSFSLKKLKTNINESDKRTWQISYKNWDWVVNL